MHVAHERILIAGENRATASFVSKSVANEVVFCLASRPGKCVAFTADTMTRRRAASFEDVPVAMLLEDGEGTGVESIQVTWFLLPPRGKPQFERHVCLSSPGCTCSGPPSHHLGLPG